jgi:hypothetical protein
MESSLTPANIAALTGIMVLGAMVPSISVLAKMVYQGQCLIPKT